MLIHRAIGDRLTCIFVDNGLLRHDEANQIQKRFRDKLHLPLDFVDATDLLTRLTGVTDPEQKRKVIGGTFIDVFETRANELGGSDFLVRARSIRMSSSPHPCTVPPSSSRAITTSADSPSA